MVSATLLPYDRHVGRYSRALAAALVRVAGVEDDGRALDVGCGTGALTAVLAARLGPTGNSPPCSPNFSSTR
jgi:ubiquinone/menaquinone biosynthesis C-methylase UbiE